MKSINPGKQRKELYNAPLHKKRKWVASHLEENLILKYDKRSIPVVKGDTVKVMRGSFKGHEDKIAKIHTKKDIVEIEGITMSKADGNKIAKPIHPSNLLITKLNLTDKWRRKKLERGLSEEAKKEIEKEAEEQIKEVEEEQKRKELEEKALEKAEEEEGEIIDEEPTESVITVKETTSEEKEKPETKKETKPEKEEPVKKTKEVKKEPVKKEKPKDTATKKTPTKKTTSSKTTKKEEK